MKRLERKLLLHCLLVGVAVTALVIAADALDMLVPLENWLYDRRARWCQLFSPPPTKTLVHLDIDDRALEVIGHWPWPRAVWAELLDEIRLAGPKAVEMDVIFSEPERTPAGDAALADAIARSGNVILSVSLAARRAEAPVFDAMVEALHAQPELGEEELVRRVRARGLPGSAGPLDNVFIQARREAVFRRIEQELARSPIAATTSTKTAAATSIATALAGQTIDSTAAVRAILRQRLLSQEIGISSPLTRLIDEQHERLLVQREAERFAFDRPRGAASVTPAAINLAPIRILSESAAGMAFVDYPQFDDPVVRSVPLLMECDGKLFPQMGLALACRTLDIDPATIRIGPRGITLPRGSGGGADGEIIIPVAPPKVSSQRTRLDMLAEVPWFGPRDWQLMYDHPNSAVAAQHLSLLAIWEARLTRDRIRANSAAVDEALGGILGVVNPARQRTFLDKPPAPDDVVARAELVRATLADDNVKSTRALYDSMLPAELAADPDGSVFVASHRAMQQWLAETPKLATQLTKSREDLSKSLKDKAALVGWIATAAVADFVPTSLHDKCPGVVVHGAVYNGIVTGELWGRWPWGVTLVLTVLLGLGTALAAGYLPPVPALLAALALFAVFAMVNGIVLFDFGNRIVGAAGPLIAIASVWSACTVTRVVVERAERESIRRRFSNYVDPKLVNFVLENPSATFDGEKREMTVVFTDLVGFTSLSEKMGEKVVPLLNDLLEELVPVIRDVHQGYINKFLGDGIMFFFNAPYLTATHARDAVATVLAMHETLARFNQRLTASGLPPLGMRAGISTGEMIVGNAGGAGT
ncbi:MAG: adenylate/guanylate cyclase domain-containing protein, partial [Tepidisphaeraceae bacterium]